MQNGSSVGICTRCIHVLALFGTDLYAQSVLINKISASELGRKLIKVALLVGPARGLGDSSGERGEDPPTLVIRTSPFTPITAHATTTHSPSPPRCLRLSQEVPGGSSSSRRKNNLNLLSFFCKAGGKKGGVGSRSTGLARGKKTKFRFLAFRLTDKRVLNNA